MSEAPSSIFRHPVKSSSSSVLKFQQSSGDGIPPMARSMVSKTPAASHTIAANVPVAGDDGIDAELWYACAGPHKALPPVGSKVAYLPQGHIEQVASFNNQDVDGQIPRYNLQAVIPCILNDITLSADPESDEVYATLMLCPLSDSIDDSSDFAEPPPPPKRKSRSFTKTLTVSDTSTHGGFSVPRRAAEDCLPKLDMTMSPPSQELIAKDLHGIEWKFKHIFRGQPKRHLLTTGWSVFVSQKRLVAGDAVLFLRGENGQLRVGVRRAPRQQSLQPKVLTSPTMHIGVLAAAAHAASEKSRFSLIYNPRSCPSEFVIPYHRYQKANADKGSFSVGQRFKMRFESDDPSDRRHTCTITGISDFDHARWPGSVWRSIKVNWDESSSDRQERVSPWEIEPFTATTALAPVVGTRKRVRQPCPTQQSNEPSSLVRSRISAEVSQNQSLRVARGAVHGGHEMRGMSTSEEEDGEAISPKMSWGIKHEISDARAGIRGQAAERWMNSRIPDAVHGSDMFRSLPVSGIQDVRNMLCIDRLDLQQKFTVKEYRENKDNMDGTTLQLSSPRPSLQCFSKSKTFNDADLNLPASSQSGRDPCKTSNLLWPPMNSNQQQPGHLPSSWLSNFRTSHSDVSESPHSGRTDCTTLSMGNLPPIDTGGVSHPPTPKSNFWESRVQPEAETSRPAVAQQTELKCKIFGVPLDQPGTPSIIPQVSISKSTGSLEELPGGNRGHDKSVTPCPTSASGGACPEQDTPPQRTAKGSSNFNQGPVRSFTKIHKQGAIGRSIDVTSFDGYADLLRKVEVMFELSGELFDKKSGWYLVYTDHEEDVLLVGDDPWNEFVSCVRTLRLLSPGEASSSAGKGLQVQDEDCTGKDGVKRPDSSSSTPSTRNSGDEN